MMNKYEESKLAYPVLEGPAPFSKYYNFENPAFKDDDLLSESSQLSRSQSVAGPSHPILFAPAMPIHNQSSLNKPTQNYSLGIVKPSEVLASLPSSIKSQPISSGIPFIPVTRAVPIIVAKDINGVKILPVKDSRTPVFTPPVYDKKKKKFYHPFWHAQEGKYYGRASCRKCKGLGYKTKDNSPCAVCNPNLCEKCWNTGVQVNNKKNKVCKKCPYGKRYEVFDKYNHVM